MNASAILDLPDGRWKIMDVELTDEQTQALEAVLARGGMPRLFWPDTVRVVRNIAAESVLRAEAAK